jgi:hypothetical protein
MLTHYFKEPKTQRHYLGGSAGPYLDEFSRWLAQHGYQRCCIRRRLRGAHRLSMWAEKTGVPLPDPNEQACQAFTGPPLCS